MASPSTNSSPKMTAKPASWRDDALSGAETIARFVAEGVSGSGVKGLEGPAKTVLGIITHLKRIRDNSAACKDVVSQIGALTQTLKSATESVRSQVQSQALPATLVQAQLGSSTELSNRIDSLQQRLNEVKTDAEALQKQSTLRRITMANINGDILKGMADKLRVSRDDFMITGQLAIEIVLRGVAADVRAAAEQRKTNELESAIEKLLNADASYRASVHARHGRLLAGTRVQLLTDLDAWVAGASQKPHEFPFFVLSGGAGTGKSTIAFEFARRAEQAGLLGASFFFTRGSALLSTTEAFFPTLARQLIANVPALRSTALPVVNEHLKHGLRQNMDNQAKDLFSGLLSSLPADHSPIVLVIDAVDECTESAQDLVPRMLFLMTDALSAISCPVRVFVTSRPEVHVEDAFQSVRFATRAQKFRLHEIPRRVIDADIRFYFTTALSELPDASRSPLFTSYPDASDDLTDLAAGLFIYATTAMEFLRRFRSAIVRGMDQIVATSRQSSKPALQRLDDLYNIVLSTSFPPEVRAIQRHNIQRVLGCVIVLQDHVSPRALSDLTGLSLDNDLLPILDRLGSVLSYELNNPDFPMRLLHASFGDFLIDSARCTDAEFHVDLALHHTSLAENCLAILVRPSTIVSNICRLDDPAVGRHHISDLNTRLNKYLPLSARYACASWLVHVALGQGDRRLLPFIVTFCRTRPLEWLEALAFLDGMEHAIHWLPIVCNLLPSTEPDSPSALLYDLFRIVLEFSPAIKACPAQLYISCICQTPRTSQLRRLYAHRLVESHVIRCPGTLVDEWTPWFEIQPSSSQRLSSGTMLRAVFSPHARWVAMYGITNGIDFCRPDTGDVVQSITAHSSPVRQIHFSSNGLRMVVAFSDRVCIVSTRSGTVLHEWIAGSGGEVLGAYFVLDGTAILIQSYVEWDDNHTVNSHFSIWNSNTMAVRDLESVPRGSGPAADPYLSLIRSIAVSSNGRWAVLVEESMELPRRRTGYVLDVLGGTASSCFSNVSPVTCFVPDTENIILAQDGALGRFDASSGALLEQFAIDLVHEHVDQIASSRDGAVVAVLSAADSTSDPDLLHVWSRDGRRSRTRRLSVSDLGDINISPDGSRILGLLRSGLAWRLLDPSGDHWVATEMVPEESEPRRERPPDRRDDAICISPDCSLVAVATLRDITIHEAQAPGNIARSISMEAIGFPSEDGVGWSPSNPTFSHDSRLIFFRVSRYIFQCAVQGDCEGILEIPDLEALGLENTLRQLYAYDPPNDRLHGPLLVLATTVSTLYLLFEADIDAYSGPDVAGARRRFYIAAGWSLERRRITRVYVVQGIPELLVVSHFSVDASENRVLHFATSLPAGVEAQDVTTAITTYTAELPPDHHRDDDGPCGVLVAAARANDSVPKERYCLSTEGWIMRTSSDRSKLGWIQPSRMPSSLRSYRSTATSLGHLVATLSDAGLLTVIDMSSFDGPDVSGGDVHTAQNAV